MELSIDTASELASVALSREGRLLQDNAWRCQRNHTVELLPRVEELLSAAGVAKTRLSAVFVSTGPGMYTGLRVGVSVAQGLARALGIPALGVGRLELDAYPYRDFDGPIVAVHRAGRGELAWASYQGRPWRELSPPRLSRPEELASAVREGALVVGEVDEQLSALLEGRTVTIRGSAAEGRARSLAELGFARLQAGETAEPALLRPIYLRPPAIGPQQRAE
jgi:tRNA threonylcarbamoyladenosine biosynthesis protein TsaB